MFAVRAAESRRLFEPLEIAASALFQDAKLDKVIRSRTRGPSRCSVLLKISLIQLCNIARRALAGSLSIGRLLKGNLPIYVGRYVLYALRLAAILGYTTSISGSGMCYSPCY